MNIQEAMDQCMDYIRSIRSPNTARVYSQSLKVLRDYYTLQKIPLTQDISIITPDHLIQTITGLSRLGLKKKSMSVYINGISAFKNWLVMQGILDISQRDIMRLKMTRDNYKRKKDDDEIIRFPERDDAGKMIEALGKVEYGTELERLRDRALLLFLMSSGCRNNEARSTLCGRVDLLNRTAIVFTKEEKERRIHFDAATQQALQEYWLARGFRGKQDAIFSRHDHASAGHEHEPISTATVRNIVDKIGRAADLPLWTPHYFRHAFAQKALRDTGNMEAVRDLLGHKSMASTAIYAKIQPDELDNLYRDVFDKEK